MTGILDYISSSFFQKPVSPDPSKTQWTYNLGYKFTSMTGTFLFFASCLVFARELIGDHIHCISDATSARVSLMQASNYYFGKLYQIVRSNGILFSYF